MAAEIKNLKKAAERIIKAVKKKEKIIIYGDSDLDGVSSVVILKETIQNLGGRIEAVDFPDRSKEGYGLNERALRDLKKYAPALLILLDCGIGNFKEVKEAEKLGFEVIIIDHHEILDKLPEASIIIDPKQKGDKYPFKFFANAGITFRLAKLILKKKMTESLRRNFLELAALATIADMMPQQEDNKEIIAEGLNYVESSWRPGLRALLEIKEFKELDFFPKVYKINSLLNISDIQNGLPESFHLLVCPEKTEAEKIVKVLLKRYHNRKEKIEVIMADLERKIFGKTDPIIFEGDSSWDYRLLGLAASKATYKYKKPVFLYPKKQGLIRGHVRAPAGLDTVQAMKNCSDCLITYGGHAPASGFTIKSKDLDIFKECLIDYFKNK